MAEYEHVCVCDGGGGGVTVEVMSSCSNTCKLRHLSSFVVLLNLIYICTYIPVCLCVYLTQLRALPPYSLSGLTSLNTIGSYC